MCPVLLRILTRISLNFNYGNFTLYVQAFQPVRLSNNILYVSPYPERINPPGLGSFPFARRYLGNRFRFLLLRLLRCFTSAGIALVGLSSSSNSIKVLPLMGSPIRISPD